MEREILDIVSKLEELSDSLHGDELQVVLDCIFALKSL